MKNCFFERVNELYLSGTFYHEVLLRVDFFYPTAKTNVEEHFLLALRKFFNIDMPERCGRIINLSNIMYMLVFSCIYLCLKLLHNLLNNCVVFCFL